MRSRLSGQCSCKLELPPWPRENHGLRHPTVGACGFPEACGKAGPYWKETGWTVPLSSAPSTLLPSPHWGWRQGLFSP